MPELSSLIHASRILLDIDADCPKAIMRIIADESAKISGLNARSIVTALNERERMGSTAVGGGVAIPHARIEGLRDPIALVLRLIKPADMDAPDDKPIDIIFVLLVPDEADNDHLRILSRVARLIRQPENLLQIRRATSTTEVAALFHEE